MKQIGKRIREIRKQIGLTLQDLSDKVNLSVSYLSQIENGQVSLSINHLETIGRALETPLIDFFNGENGNEISLVRSSNRRWFSLGKDAAESPLVSSRRHIEIFVIRLAPMSGQVNDSIHHGEEFTFVIKGSVVVTLGEDETYELNEGDVIYYKSDIPHRWQNNGNETAELLVANTPATF